MNVRSESNETTFELPVGPRHLPGTLTVPEGGSGVVLFAHGSGSSRFSPRNRAVARQLQANGMATLLFDLLHEHEWRDRRTVFDIDLLSTRLTEAVDWVCTQQSTRELVIGLFGASTGSAAALTTAIRRPAQVAAIVSRGGRPDLADHLEQVQAPTLLIVGGLDGSVVELNRAALGRLTCAAKLEIVPGATHLFAEPGTLAQVACLATTWFQAHLQTR